MDREMWNFVNRIMCATFLLGGILDLSNGIVGNDQNKRSIGFLKLGVVVLAYQQIRSNPPQPKKDE